MREREREEERERRGFMSERETPIPTLGNAQLVEFRWKSSLTLSLSHTHTRTHNLILTLSHPLLLTMITFPHLN